MADYADLVRRLRHLRSLGPYEGFAAHQIMEGLHESCAAIEALVAERDLIASNANTLNDRLNAAVAERDALRAEVAELRAVLADLDRDALAELPPKEELEAHTRALEVCDYLSIPPGHEGEWVVFKKGKPIAYGATPIDAMTQSGLFADDPDAVLSKVPLPRPHYCDYCGGDHPVGWHSDTTNPRGDDRDPEGL